MDFPTDDLLREVLKLDAVQRIKVSIRSSIKYGTMVGVATIIGGICGGPVGLAVGGIVSSCVGGYMSQGQVRSVPYIIYHETTLEQKQKLAREIVKLLKSKHITTLNAFIQSVRSNVDLETAVLEIVIMFLSSTLGMCVSV